MRDALAGSAAAPRLPVEVSDLIVATECGGSDATSGLTANPAIGIACDHVIEAGGTPIFEKLGELFGCEQHMAERDALGCLRIVLGDARLQRGSDPG